MKRTKEIADYRLRVVIEAYISAIFRAWGANHDGKLARAELKRADGEGVGVAAVRVLAEAKAADADERARAGWADAALAKDFLKDTAKTTSRWKARGRK